jgi:hydroxyacylglutathione hydrolase
MRMQVETAVTGAFQANCFVVWGDARQAIVIDPGADAEEIADILTRRNLGVAAYVLTHGHVDHVCGLADLCERFPAPAAMHRADLAWAFTEGNHMLPFYSAPRKPPEPVLPLDDGQARSDGALDYRVIASPGHSPGSICLHFEREQALFTGDTLFAGSVGRTDLRGGDSRAMAASLARLAQLPPATVVYPGHGPPTTIRREREANYFMADLRASTVGGARLTR